jgi:uncharacterized repeat protein (TIGR01451 family)/CSLREA domain-containing protein
VLSAVITVTTAADDLTPNDGSVSLREAITAANANSDLGDQDIIAQNPGTFGAGDTIQFDIPGSGVHTITPLSVVLPTITDPVIIDGYTQPGASPNTLATSDNAQLLIALNGSNFGPNAGFGLTVTGGNSTIRGLVIDAFSFNGLTLQSDGNVVEGNIIGLDPTGATAGSFGNKRGVEVSEGSGNTIGGTTPAARNIISGNGPFEAVFVLNSTGTLVQGNFIGTDITGTTAPGKSGGANGVLIDGGSGNFVGGTAAGAGNTIAGNGSAGVYLFTTTGNFVQGNLIGTNAAGAAGLGNLDGVYIDTSTNNTIGGTAPGAGNVITGNGVVGVLVAGAGTIGNLILSNSLFNNNALGVDLVGGTQDPSGVTANDPGDPDTGPNNLQNYPVLTSVTNSAGTTTIQGTLNSLPSTTFRIEFFANAAAHRTGFGEGQTFLGSTDVTTNSSGDGSFTFMHATPSGTFFTATATRTDGEGGLIETSEFSAAVTQQAVAPTVTINQAAGQADPTSSSPILFTVVFSTAVTGFTASDVSFAGSTVGGTLVAGVSGSGADYTVSVTGMTGNGTVVASIPAGAAANSSDTPSAASTSTDNVVMFVTQADESVTETGPPSVSAGANLTYTITVSNAGPSDAQGVSISDALPPGTTFVSFVAPVGFTAATPAAGATGTVTASASTLAAGQSASFTLVVRVDSAASGGTIISNTAQATTTTADTNLANNSATATTQVQQPTAATGLTITLVSRQAKYKNEFGLFIVDDAQGRIGNL